MNKTVFVVAGGLAVSACTSVQVNAVAENQVNAISQISGMTIEISPPDICIDMVGSILSVPAIHFANISDKVIFIEDEFEGSGANEASNILLIPDVDSLDRLIDKLGLGV